MAYSGQLGRFSLLLENLQMYVYTHRLKNPDLTQLRKTQDIPSRPRIQCPAPDQVLPRGPAS